MEWNTDNLPVAADDDTIKSVNSDGKKSRLRIVMFDTDSLP